MMTFKKLLLVMFAVLFCMGSGIVAAKTTASADTYFKQIRGVRWTAKNEEKISEKKKVQKKIKKVQRKITAINGKISKLSTELLAYEELQTKTGYLGTVFADNGRGTNTFEVVAGFDPYFKKIENYGIVNENLLNSEYLNPSVENNNSSLASMVSDQTNTVAFLETGNTDVVDISRHLEYSISRKKLQIEKEGKRLEKVKKKVSALKKKAKKIITKDIVFNAEDVTENSNITVKKMRELLRGTRLEQFADVYVEIEKEYGINAIVLCALSAYESGWGESRRALVDHNYTGFGVYSDSARGINASSGEQNLWMTAKFLANNYLQRGQEYYHGVGLDGLNRSYSTAATWAYDIEYIGMQLMETL